MWQEIGTYVGGILGTAAAVAVLTLTSQAAVWLKAHISEAKQKALGEAADKLLTLGIMKLAPLIAAEGWDSPKVKEALIQFGVDNVAEKFPDVRAYVDKMVGQGPAFGPPLQAENILRDVLERALPAAATKAAASPVTPPAPPAVVATVPAEPDAVAGALVAAARGVGTVARS